MPLPDFLSATSRAHELAVATPRSNTNDAPYGYGTSGFRGHADTLPAVALRMGMFAALRSSLLGGVIGVMVTASHNEAPDNGLKIIDPSGAMMETSAETVATAIANAEESRLCESLNDLIVLQSIDLSRSRPRVFVGRDTRHSSPSLCQLVVEGAKAMGAEVVDNGLLTTPVLHFAVSMANNGVTHYDYFQILSDAFKQSLAIKGDSESAVTLAPLVVDCANGVGTVSLQKFQSLLRDTLPLTLMNTNIDDTHSLNAECGAEHVQKSRTLPANFTYDASKYQRCASVDGDADRLVYFFVNDASQMRLLDGDKILVLYTAFVHRLLQQAQLSSTLTIGCVQTAYANGASVKYIREQLGIEPQFTPSGVKHLHHVAAEFDIGVYFESNGHGTLLFSDRAKKTFAAVVNDSGISASVRRSAQCLLWLASLINQCVGDAVSDMLLVEVALHHLGWSLADWDAIYHDLPSLTLKVKVKDRSVITVTDAERKCVTPAGLQDAIDAAVNNATAELRGNRRSFARPSGTEDVVRVYAEASTPEECAELANAVCDAVAKHAGGI